MIVIGVSDHVVVVSPLGGRTSVKFMQMSALCVWRGGGGGGFEHVTGQSTFSQSSTGGPMGLWQTRVDLYFLLVSTSTDNSHSSN